MGALGAGVGAAVVVPGVAAAQADDGLDERLETDLFAKLLAEGDGRETPKQTPVVPENPANAQVDIANRMLGAMDAEDPG